MYRVIVIVLAFMLGVFIFFGADSAKTRGQKKWVKAPCSSGSGRSLGQVFWSCAVWRHGTTGRPAMQKRPSP